MEESTRGNVRDPACLGRQLFDLVTARWASLVLVDLMDGPQRWSELRRARWRRFDARAERQALATMSLGASSIWASSPEVRSPPSKSHPTRSGVSGSKSPWPE